jgi:hypothetical protein
MNKRILLALGIALSFAATARAGNALPPQLLAEVDAILSSCAEIDERDEAKFRALHRSLTAGASDRELDAVEKTPLFRDTFKAVQVVVRGMQRDDAMQLCLATIQGEEKPGDTREEHRRDDDRTREEHRHP